MADVQPLKSIRGPLLSAADRLVLRVALGATLGFAVAMALDWEFSFLTPMLAVSVLIGMPSCPKLGQGLAIPIALFLSTTVALAASSLLADAPAVLVAVVGLALFFSFYGLRLGAPGIVMLLVQIAFCGVPLFSTASLDHARSLADFLQGSSLAAIIVVWICHAAFPAPAPPPGAAAPPPPARLPPAYAARVAVSDVLVLLPVLINFMLGGDTDNFVILVITINLVSAMTPGGDGRLAIVLLLGNFIGGALAVIAQQFVLLADTLAYFLLMVFLAGLWFAGRVARGGPKAPLYVLGLSTFLLLLGLAITPLPGGSEQSFVIRILKIGVAGLYALGALSLVSPLRRIPAAAS